MPLAEELTKRRYIIWYDKFELVVGDQLSVELDRGLGRCRFGVVILRKYLAKECKLDGWLIVCAGDE